MDISKTLSVEDILHAFVEKELLADSGVDAAAFWRALETILADFTPRNAALLARRDELQAKIDGWWLERRGKPFDVAEEDRVPARNRLFAARTLALPHHDRRRGSRDRPSWPGRSWWCRSPTAATP